MGRERDLNLVSNNTGMRRKEILIMRLNKLLSPGKIGTLELKNRFVVPPMGTNLATYNGEVKEEMIAYYRRRAKGGFGNAGI